MKNIKDHHYQFLKLICSEMTYKEIGLEMGKSEYDAHNYAQFLCRKFKVTGRFGLMLYSIKNKIVKPNEIKFKRDSSVYARQLLDKRKVVFLAEQPILLGEE